jgi:hypothetical protein
MQVPAGMLAPRIPASTLSLTGFFASIILSLTLGKEGIQQTMKYNICGYSEVAEA